MFIANKATQVLLGLVLHHPSSAVTAAAARALPVLLQNSPATALVQLLESQWQEITELLPQRSSAASAVLKMLAMFSSAQDVSTARTMLRQAFPLLLKQQSNDDGMRCSLAQTMANTVLGLACASCVF